MKPLPCYVDRCRSGLIRLSVINLLGLVLIPQSLYAADYYVCQTNTGKRYSEKPCAADEVGAKLRQSNTGNESERQRLEAQLKREKSIGERWQAARQKQEARAEREIAVAARQRKLKNARCEEARLRAKLASDDLSDGQPRQEMALRKRLQQQQQRAELLCKN